MTRLTTLRNSALALIGSAGLALNSPAYALYSGTVLNGNQVPDWALGNASCSGTLITPRVALTAGHCTGHPYSGFYHRKTGHVYYGKTVTYPERYGPLGDIGLVIMDTQFGGSANTKTAPIATYLEEKQALRDGNDAGTTGTPLVVYGQNSLSDNFITQARTTDAYTGEWLGSGKGYLEGKKLLYRSVGKYLKNEPDRVMGRYINSREEYNIFKPELATFMYARRPAGLQLLTSDVDDAVLLTAREIEPYAGTPVFSGDSGGGIFFRKPNGELRLAGTVSGKDAHTRLAGYWPWVVNTLVKNGLRNDAFILSQKVLGTGNWQDNDRKGQVGQIYVYDNPYSPQLEYFRLAGVDASGRYADFPIDRKDNQSWEYLGNKLPDREQATAQVRVWDDNDQYGALGEIFLYNNPYARQVQYLQLATLDGNGRKYWEVLADLPTHPLIFAARIN